MGFLRKYSLIIFFALAGCSVSIIKLEYRQESNLLQSFAQNSEKNFFVDDTLSLPLKLKWHLETHGNFAFSSFLTYGGNIIASDLSGRVYSFDLSTGKRSGMLKMKGTISVTPIINRIYLIFPVTLIPDAKTSLLFYDFLNGKEIQEVEFDGIVTTEVVRNDKFFVVATEEGKVRKINYMGEILFSVDLEGYTHSSGAMDDQFYFIGNDKGELFKIDLTNGKILCRKKISDEPLRSISLNNDVVFIGGEDGFIYLFNSEKETIEKKKYFGEKILMHPVVHENLVYCGSTGGEFSAYDLIQEKFIWAHKFDNSFAAAPLIVGDKIVLPSLNKKIYFLDKLNGEILDSLQFENRVKSTPIFYKDFLIIGSDNGIISVYESH